MDVDTQEDQDARALFEERAESGGNSGGTLAERLTQPDEKPIPEKDEPEDHLDEPEIEVESEEAEVEAKAETKEEPAPDYQALARAVANLEAKFGNGLRDLNGKFGGLNQQIGQIKADFTAAKQASVATVKSGEAAPSQTQINEALEAKAKGDNSKFKALRDQGFEEWTDAFDERLAPLENAIQKFSKAQEPKVVEQKPVSDPRVDELLAREQQRNYDMQIEALKSRHPDFIEVSDSDSFKVFVASLPEEVAHVVKTSTNANVASYYLDLYKSQSSGKTRAQVDAERGGKLRGAVNPIRGQASGKRTVVSEDDMTPEQLFDYRARLEAKQR
jgi:hypothetical protein